MRQFFITKYGNWTCDRCFGVQNHSLKTLNLDLFAEKQYYLSLSKYDIFSVLFLEFQYVYERRHQIHYRYRNLRWTWVTHTLVGNRLNIISPDNQSHVIRVQDIGDIKLSRLYAANVLRNDVCGNLVIQIVKDPPNHHTYGHSSYYYWCCFFLFFERTVSTTNHQPSNNHTPFFSHQKWICNNYRTYKKGCVVSKFSRLINTILFIELTHWSCQHAFFCFFQESSANPKPTNASNNIRMAPSGRLVSVLFQDNAPQEYFGFMTMNNYEITHLENDDNNSSQISRSIDEQTVGLDLDKIEIKGPRHALIKELLRKYNIN